MNRRKVVAIAATAVIGFGALATKFYYDRHNGAALAIDTGTHQRHYVGPVGYQSLEIKQGEPIDIGFSAGDWDGLERISITLDGDVIYEGTKFSFNAQSGVITRTFPDLKTGKHSLELIAVDKTGQRRTDTASLTVRNEVYNP